MTVFADVPSANDLGGSARLTLRNVTISNQAGTWVSGGSAVWMGGPGVVVLIEDSRVDLGNAGGAACLVEDDNSATASAPFAAALTIRRSTLTRCAGGALQFAGERARSAH